MRSVIVFFLLVQSSLLFAQAFEDVNTIGMISAKPAAATHSDFTIIKMNQATSVKNQSRTGTCWSFSTVSLVESQTIKNNLVALDLSEMFIVRNIYVEKAKNYILRQGHAQFSEGGLGHDVISAISVYGAVPESVYPGLKKQATHDHTILFKSLKKYLDSTLKRRQNLPINNDWLPCFNNILDEYLGEIPRQFTYNGQKYTPQSFAKEVLKFNPDDYINITSFTHHPYYTPFIIEVPDNFSNGSYYNLPLKEMIGVVKNALTSGYTVMWDTDVSNEGFNLKVGMGLNMTVATSRDSVFADKMEEGWDEKSRQLLFENLTTQDDHLMHIIGIEKSKKGKDFFIVKNSYGITNSFEGLVNVSEAYFAMNTISIVVPKAALSKAMLDKLKN